MPAQTLPQLPVDSRIRQGELNCGVRYYLVTNPAVKGFADIAIVRRDGGDGAPVRPQLDSLPHFAGRAPWRFLADNGIGCREEGWCDTREGATLYRFDHVPTFDESVQDSTLLLAFNLIAESPADQAIIVSGDIKARDILDKMAIFSLTVPARSATEAPQPVPSADTAVFRFIPGADTLLARVRVSYFAPRTAPEYRNTAMPLVAENIFDEMGVVIRERLAAALRRHAYPFADIRYRHTGSARTAGDERHEVSVLTDRYHLQAVGSVIAATLASVKAGVPPEEFASAKGRLGPAMARLGREKRFSNAAYVEQCSGAFLYGGDLAPLNQRVSLYARKLPAETESALFNGVAGALTERRSRLQVDYCALPDSIYSLDPIAFHALSWDAGAQAGPPRGALVRPDTLSLRAPGGKTKLKKSLPDPLSGGELWTFANGLQVIFKKMGSDGHFSYALFVKGGYNSVADLLPGEGAFFSDLLGCFDVAGMRGADFFAALASSGVEMVPEVSASGLCVRGEAPYNELELTLRALISLANDRRYHPQAVQDYFREEAFRLRAADPAGKRAYDAIFPDYKLSPCKDAERLVPAVARKAEKYFNDRFQNLQDGVLVICGDLPAEALKKTLASYMGAFRTGRSTAVRRAAPAQARPGVRTLRLEGGPERAEIFISAPLAYTAANHVAARIALLALRKQLVAALSPQGFSFELEGAFATYPTECFQLWIHGRPARSSGLPASFGEADARAMLSALREALAHPALSPADFNGFKASVVQEMSDELTDPDRLVRAVLVRYAEGKDLVSRFAEQAGGVSADQVKEVLAALSAGSRAEILAL